MKKYNKLYILAKRKMIKLEHYALDRGDTLALQAIRQCMAALWNAYCEVSQNEHI